VRAVHCKDQKEENVTTAKQENVAYQKRSRERKCTLTPQTRQACSVKMNTVHAAVIL